MKMTKHFGKEADKRHLYKVLKSLKPVLYNITITQARESRTDRQRRYYFGVIVKVLALELGYTKDEMHDVLKLIFCPNRKKLPNGQEVLLPGSTKEWDIESSEEKHEEIRNWAARELDIYVPLPNEMMEV